MGARPVEKIIRKEFTLWTLVSLAGYATFTSFEPLYEQAKHTAEQAGLADFFAARTAPEMPPRIAAGVTPFAGLNLRGTLPGGPGVKPAAPVRKVTLSANPFGHFTAQAEINGQDVEFMTDTGATYVALTYETAMKLGIAPGTLRFTGRSTTANGVARVASITLDRIRVGSITVPDVQAVVAEPGRMSQNLLGMSFIGRLSGFELSRGKLVITE